MKDRIKQLMESQNMTQQEFASYVGMSPATLSSIFNGRTQPTLQIARAIRMKYPHLKYEWLINGEGEMFEQDTQVKDAQSENPLPTDMGAVDAGQRDLFAASFSFEEAEVPSAQEPLAKPLPAHPHESTVQVGKMPRIPVVQKVVEPVYVKRQITEIRIYFDDSTYETFAPKGK